MIVNKVYNCLVCRREILSFE